MVLSTMVRVFVWMLKDYLSGSVAQSFAIVCVGAFVQQRGKDCPPPSLPELLVPFARQGRKNMHHHRGHPPLGGAEMTIILSDNNSRILTAP